MAIISSGVLLKTPGDFTVWTGTPSQWPYTLDLGLRWASYAEIYKRHPDIAALVNKIANATARLPLKVYERDDLNRPEDRRSPYAQLLRRPNTVHNPYNFWLWTVSTLNIYGEAFWGKVRDRGGRPVELVPLHPTAVRSEDRDGRTVWWYDDGKKRIDDIPRRDLVHFRFYNPTSTSRGLSPLEPLRATLENEDGARKANSALWRNGARPSFVLRHPGKLSEPAAKRLAESWASLHGSADNWAKTAVLEEGVEPQVLSLNAEELQYIEGRKLNHEEACMVYDVPPPVVHILDRATFSNITEQMRSMYRDTMAPRLRLLEETMEHELRDGSFGDGTPDFGDDVYGEFLLDEVLRGDFEQRAEAYQKGVNSGWITPAEIRQKENLRFIEGSDRLLVNSTMVPLETAGTDEGEMAEVVPLAAVRTVLGRLSRQKSLDEVDGEFLTQGLNGHAATVLAELETARAAGEDVAGLRSRIKALGG